MDYLDFTLTISTGAHLPRSVTRSTVPDSVHPPDEVDLLGSRRDLSGETETPETSDSGGSDASEALVQPGSDRPYTVRIESPAGSVSVGMAFPFTPQELELHLKDVENAILRSGRTSRLALTGPNLVVQEFGQDLFRAILPEDGRGFYYQSWDRAKSAGKGLRFKLQIETPELASLPWEFLNDPRDDSYLGLSTGTPVVREVRVARPFDPLVITGPLRILGMVASPRELAPLDTDGERQRVETALADLIDAGRVELKWLGGQTWYALEQEIRNETFHIFHFIGHGGFDPNADQGMIALADEDGGLDLFPASDLALLLRDEWQLRLAVLNACEGAKGSAQDVFSSAASILVRSGGVPAVLAMQYEITDTAAIAFARFFYGALADGMPVDAAVASARRGMRLADRRSLEWATPVLYQQAPHGILFNITNEAARVTQPPPGESSRPLHTFTSAAIRTAAVVGDRLRRFDDRALARYRSTRLGPLAVVAVGVIIAACLALLLGIVQRDSWHWALVLLLGGALVATAVAGKIPWTQWSLRGQGFLRPGVALVGMLLAGVALYGATQTPDAVLPPAVKTDVAMFRGDPARSGNQPGPGPVSDKPHVRVLFAAGGRVTGSSAVVDGILYFGSYDNQVYAVDAVTGSPVWEEPFETLSEIASSPTVHGGKVYIGSRDGHLYAIDQATGEERWRQSLGAESQVNSSPAVVDGVVYVGSTDGNLYAVDAGTGELSWRRPFKTLGGMVYSSPTVVDGLVYVGSGNFGANGYLQAVDAATGTEQWTFEVAGMVVSSPAVVDRVVYIGSYGFANNDGRLYAVDAATGEPRWPQPFVTHRTGPHGRALVYSSPAVADGRVYVGSFDGHVYAVDVATGRQTWVFPRPPAPSLQEVWSSPAVTNGIVYIGTGKPSDPTDPDELGFLYALDAGSGRVRWQLQFDAPITSSPTVVDGVLFMGDHDGNVYAIWDKP